MLKTIARCIILVAVAQVHAQPRIEHIGQASRSEAAPSMVDMRTDLMTAARTIFPPGWDGFAHKDMDVRRPSQLHMSAGEPWLIALDRWLAQERMTARIDWNERKFFLRGAPGGVQAPQAAPGQQAAYPGQYAGQYQGAHPAQPSAGLDQGLQQAAGTPVQHWTILTSDVRLEATFDRWAKQAGHKLVWDADRDILISAADAFTGTLPDAIDRVLASPAIRDSDYPLEAVFYANTPPVVRITRLGDQSVKE